MRVKGQYFHEQLSPPHGFACFCQSCGSLWSTLKFPGKRTFVWTAPCADHPTGYDIEVAGSIIRFFDDYVLDSDLPLEVWRREARLHAEHSRREDL